MNSDSWLCVRCHREESERNLQRGLTPEYKYGVCIGCHSNVIFRHPTGDELRAVGMTLAANADGEWSAKAQWGINELRRRGGPFTANDLTDLIGLPEHRNAVGAAISGAAKAGIIRLVGWRKGDRASQHARRISEWEGI